MLQGTTILASHPQSSFPSTTSVLPLAEQSIGLGVNGVQGRFEHLYFRQPHSSSITSAFSQARQFGAPRSGQSFWSLGWQVLIPLQGPAAVFFLTSHLPHDFSALSITSLHTHSFAVDGTQTSTRQFSLTLTLCKTSHSSHFGGVGGFGHPQSGPATQTSCSH